MRTGILASLMMSFRSTLEFVKTQIDNAQKGNFFVRLMRNKDIEAQLDDAKSRLERARRLFEVSDRSSI